MEIKREKVKRRLTTVMFERVEKRSINDTVAVNDDHLSDTEIADLAAAETIGNTEQRKAFNAGVRFCMEYLLMIPDKKPDEV